MGILTDARRAILLRAFFLLLATLGMLGVGIASAADAPLRLSQQAVNQITLLLAEKETRTAVSNKIDSQLIYASRMALGFPAAAGVPMLETGIIVDTAGLVDVEIRALLTPDIQQAIAAAGGKVIRSFEFASAIDARLPLGALQTVAALPGVMFIRPKAQGMTTRAFNPSLTAQIGVKVIADPSAVDAEESTSVLTPRLKKFKETVQRALDSQKIGSRTSRGDVTHRADAARLAFGVNGAGLRIGVLSDSFNNLGGAAADVAAGDLPGPGNPNGFLTPVRFAGTGDFASGGSDEGRAMLQIVHDLAPGAQLYFASAFDSITAFANNIRALRGIAASGNISPGCDIIIDDIFYFVESGLHDGQPAPTTQNMAVVTQAVNDVTANGAMYFSAAGNSGNLYQGTSGAWEGDFISGPLPITITGGGDALAWNGSDVGNLIITGAGSAVTMQWSDPAGASTNDYDLFRLDGSLTIVLAASTNAQNGTQDPFESISSAVGSKVVVVRRAGAAARFISLSTNRGALTYATSGQIRGHAGAANAYAVAATPVAAGAGSTGPFPDPFIASNVTETFSSDGPRRVFFNANGTAVTPGNVLAGTGGGLVRPKPDLTAADGVSTTLPSNSGLNPFYGTSAAAPHLGAIAALVKSRLPSATPAQIRSFLTSTALDIMTSGTDVTSGPGIAQAFQAVQAAQPAFAPQFAYVPTSGSTLTATGGALVGSAVPFTITPSVVAAGSAGGGATATTTLTCTPPTAEFSGFAQTVTATGSGPISGGLLSGSCTLAATAQSKTLNCSENRGGTPTAVSWTLSCPVGNAPPNLAYAPTAGSTVAAFAGITTVGTVGNASVAVAPSSGSGSGATATSTVTSCAFTGTDAANFSGASAVNLSFVGNTTTAQNISLSCASGSTARSASLTCIESLGGGVQTQRVWPLSCPLGTMAPQFGYVPTTGGTVAATGGTLVGSTGALTITPSVATAGSGSGATVTTSLTCTPPTSPFSGFTQTVTATGSGAILSGPLSGRCTLAATAQTQMLNCSENRGGAVTPVSWTLSCPEGSSAPQFGYAPATGATVKATGGTGVGSTGALAITPSLATLGSGNSVAATTTLNCAAPSGAFSGFSQSLSATGSGTITGGPLSGSCTLAAIAQTQTLSCTQNRGGVVTPVNWTLSCPVGCSLNVTGGGAGATATADKDGVLLNRYLLGFRGAALIDGVFSSPAPGTAQAVETFIGSGAQFDVFGRTTPVATATQDSLVLIRLMLSVPDTALLGGITLPSDALFTSAAAVRANVNARCGTTY